MTKALIDGRALPLDQAIDQRRRELRERGIPLKVRIGSAYTRPQTGSFYNAHDADDLRDMELIQTALLRRRHGTNNLAPTSVGE